MCPVLLVFGGSLAFIVFVSACALFCAFVCSFEFDEGSFGVSLLLGAMGSSVSVLLCSPCESVLLLSRDMSLLCGVVCSSRAFVMLFCVLICSLLVSRYRCLFDALVTALIVLSLSMMRGIGLVRSISNIWWPGICTSALVGS